MIDLTTNGNLTNLELHHESIHGCEKYYLTAEYVYENDYGINKVNIPHIMLPVSTKDIVITSAMNRSIDPDILINLGFGDLKLRPINGFYYNVTQIEKKPRKMTLSEIEKRLGHKIELVSEK